MCYVTNCEMQVGL